MAHGHINDMVQLDGGAAGMLVASQTGGVWMIDRNNDALPLSDRWNKPDVNCLVAGPDGVVTAFNGAAGNNSVRDVVAVDARNNVTAYGKEEMRLFDKVNGYFHMDLGLGYTHDASNARVELYVNNVTDEAHATQVQHDNQVVFSLTTP